MNPFAWPEGVSDAGDLGREYSRFPLTLNIWIRMRRPRSTPLGSLSSVCDPHRNRKDVQRANVLSPPSLGTGRVSGLEWPYRPFQVRGPTGREALLPSRRGNPSWATPLHLGVVPAGASTFEHVVVMLRLSPEEYESSAALKPGFGRTKIRNTCHPSCYRFGDSQWTLEHEPRRNHRHLNGANRGLVRDLTKDFMEMRIVVPVAQWCGCLRDWAD